MSLKYSNNILVQKMINLTQRAILQAFFAVVSNLSTELSTDSVDNKSHQKKSQQFPRSQSVFRLFCVFFWAGPIVFKCELPTHYCHGIVTKMPIS